MAQRNINRIKNATFKRGRRVPTSWHWSAGNRTDRQLRLDDKDRNGSDGGVRIIRSRRTGRARLFQQVPCRAGKFYRVEADVRCRLKTGPKTAPPTSGLFLAVRTVGRTSKQHPAEATPAIRTAPNPVTIRAYYRVPDGIDRIEVTVGIENASGQADVLAVRVIEIIEPEARSHPLAIPTPAWLTKPPVAAKRINIYSVQTDRPIEHRLTQLITDGVVQILAPTACKPARLQADAVLLPDDAPPPALRSLSALERIARNRVVVVSLRAFARLANAGLSIRRVEQPDDPIHATITYGGFATIGFALQDAIPFAWPGSTPDSFVQRHFRRTAKLKQFCESNGYAPLLKSLCDQDVTSDRVVALVKPTKAGAMFVLDIEPMEAKASTFAEPALPMHLLLNILGQTVVGLGQHVVPEDDGASLRTVIRELAVRFEPIRVHDDNVPADAVRRQLVTVGETDESLGLPLRPRPVILVRTGLSSGDCQGLYGALTWFKQLVRMPPHTCPYATPLASRFRLAWLPLTAPWESKRGWRRHDQIGPETCELDVEPGALQAMIDIIATDGDGADGVHARVHVPADHPSADRLTDWLPRLARNLGIGRYALPQPIGNIDPTGAPSLAWRMVPETRTRLIQVIPTCADTRGATPAATARTPEPVQPIRIELPATDADFQARSIWHNDLAATLLEWTIGLQYGLVAVNRDREPAVLEPFGRIAPGEALVIDADDPRLSAQPTTGAASQRSPAHRLTRPA